MAQELHANDAGRDCHKYHIPCSGPGTLYRFHIEKEKHKFQFSFHYAYNTLDYPILPNILL